METKSVDINAFLVKHQLPLKYQYISEQYFSAIAQDILTSKKQPLYLSQLMAAKAQEKPHLVII